MTDLIKQLKEDFSLNLVVKAIREFRDLADEAGLERSCFIEVSRPRFDVKKLKFVVDIDVIVWHNELVCYTIDSGTNIPLLVSIIEQQCFEAHMACSMEVEDSFEEACTEANSHLWLTEKGLAALAA